MKKATFISLLFIPLFSYLLPAQNQNWCGFDNVHEQRLQSDADYARNYDEYTRQCRREFSQQELEDLRSGAVNYVPVVFHIVHDNGTGNISKAQIDDGLRVLNEDFRRQNADAGQTRAVFLPYATDSEIEFRLAQKDPNGNCTSGIVRVNSPSATYDADDNVKYSATGGSDGWPYNKYLNIWVVNTIDVGQGPNVLGYAYLPNTAPWPDYGIVIRHSSVGTIGTSNSDGRTLTHEMGHSMGLLHTFNNSCGSNCQLSGDGICDTPPANVATYFCNLNQNTCSNDANGPSPYASDVNDQIENYMSYDNCQNMFTSGQKSLMKWNLQNVSVMQQLVSAANLTATGTDGNNILCAADFISDRNFICAGETVNFVDESYHGATQWNWTFYGGPGGTSTQQNPTVAYYAPGLYDVSLTASNGIDNKSVTKTDYLKVLPSPGVYPPYQEGFESISVPGDEWSVLNYDNAFHKWQITNAVGYSGSNSLKMQNYANADGAIDEVISTSIDLSTLQSATFSFRLAFAQRDNLDNDRLFLYVSTNCGLTWSLRWSALGANLATVSPQASQWQPSGVADWTQVNVTLTNTYMTENFLFKFKFESNQGNNLFIDDINLWGPFDPVPLLIWPPDGSQNMPDALTIDWKSVGGVNQYEYQLDDNPAFSSPVTGTHTFISNDPNNSDTEYAASGLTWGVTHYWRVRTVTGGNPSAWSQVWDFKVSANGVGTNETLQENFPFAIYPNPVDENTVVAFNLPEKGMVKMEVLDVTGRLMTLPFNGMLHLGNHTVELNAGGLPPGIYLLRLQAGSVAQIRKFAVH